MPRRMIWIFATFIFYVFNACASDHEQQPEDDHAILYKYFNDLFTPNALIKVVSENICKELKYSQSPTLDELCLNAHALIEELFDGMKNYFIDKNIRVLRDSKFSSLLRRYNLSPIELNMLRISIVFSLTEALNDQEIIIQSDDFERFYTERSLNFLKIKMDYLLENNLYLRSISSFVDLWKHALADLFNELNFQKIPLELPARTNPSLNEGKSRSLSPRKKLTRAIEKLEKSRNDDRKNAADLSSSDKSSVKRNQSALDPPQCDRPSPQKKSSSDSSKRTRSTSLPEAHAKITNSSDSLRREKGKPQSKKSPRAVAKDQS